MTHSYTDFRDIISKVKDLNDKEKQHVLSIFKKHNVDFTKNSNGYFFNLDKISPDVIEKVAKCTELIEQKRELISSLDKKRDAHLEYYKELIENKLKETIKYKRDQYICQLILIPLRTYITKKPKNFVRITSNEDPDILMKEYNKSKKPQKNSSYYKLSQILTTLSKKTNRPRCITAGTDTHSDADDNDNADNAVDDDDDIDADIVTGDDDDIDKDNLDDINSNDIDIEDELADLSDDENCAVKDIDPDEYYDDSSSVDSETESITDLKTDRTDKKTKKKTDSQISSVQLDYYKKLLKQTGFKFDEDKHVIVQKEAYIE